MEPYGAAYDPTRGYQQYAQPPNQVYMPAASSFVSGQADLPAVHDNSGNGFVVYAQTRDVIPGLGLGTSHSNVEYQPTQPGLSSSGDALAHIIPAHDVYTRGLPQGRNYGSSSGANQAQLSASQQVRSEEGEISEGASEDLYEPQDLETADDYDPTDRYLGDPDAVKGTLARERSGSYSPYLSPQEMELSKDASPQADLGDLTALSDANDNNLSNNLQPAQRTTGDASANSTRTVTVKKSLADVRKEARLAISRLQPFNVRFQDYLGEGIDKATVEDLFKELGLEIASAEFPPAHHLPPTPPSVAKLDANPTPVDNSTQDAPGHKSPAGTPLEKPETKSESRKDRIARLLAAKKSKTAAKPNSAKTAPVPSDASKSSMAKKQSEKLEKSKLLQQKMEALNKAREAQKKAQEELSAAASSEPAKDVQDASQVAVAPQATRLLDSAQGSGSITPQSSTSTSGVRSTSALDSTSLKAHSKRPLPSDLGDASVQPSKRPFGGVRESKPFLIDVSDDEDDAEMDLDSPSQTFATLNSSNTPSAHVLSATSGGLLSASNASPGLGSPGQVAASPGARAHKPGTVDLASMNKRIEAMKRRIAEAEARKKMKPSLPNSPNQSGVQALEGNVESNAELTRTVLDEQSSARVTELLSEIENQAVKETLEPSPVLPGQERRSRSRAASERISAIEEQRRARVLKIQALQSQIASIEQEIEDSRMEESKLRDEEAVDAVSEANLEDQPDSSSAELESDNASEDMGNDAIDEIIAPAQSKSPEKTPNAKEDEQEAEMTPGLEDIRIATEPGQSVTTESRDVDLGEGDDDLLSEGASEQNPTPAADLANGSADISVDEPSDESMSDGYDPPDAESPDSERKSSDSFSPEEVTDIDLDQSLPNTKQQISAGQEIPSPELETAALVQEELGLTAPGSTFQPYVSPLQYFHAYRFHPEFTRSVSGGLRSLTYSNSIDVRQSFCPDQLVGQACPRGTACEFQHFENVQAPDDQILVQLGHYANYDEDQKQAFVAGLRNLLTDFRDREVKDFETISQGVIEYRAQFQNDKTKILPLGNVNI